jgi:alginate O-acetyltransferase complex protein AlgI
MLFNSLDFAIFLPIVFFLYWFICNRNLTLQNLLIVVSGYVFYGWWDWRFLALILFSTVVDYTVGRLLAKEQREDKRKYILWISIAINLGFLGFFKYYNFFIDNFIAAFSLFGNDITVNSLNVILPVGISFYTFQSLSYTIDVYKRKLEPTNDFITFAAFISFFPPLVAGPIERARLLLPQFYTKRTFDYAIAVDGLRQILWGLFKKVVIADNCAEYANLIFNNSTDYSGLTLLIGAIFFTIQIYGDFSGYSDIAIGTSRLFGISLSPNFSFPYFSRSIAEFWRRWHISLSSWFREYLYIPLGGSQVGVWKKIRNTFIIFLVSGFWHGANWTFIVWGGLNALYILPSIVFQTNRKHLNTPAEKPVFPTIVAFFQIASTFMLTVVAWIFFRAENMTHAISFLKNMLSGLFHKWVYFRTFNFVQWKIGYTTPSLILAFFILEWIGREGAFAIERLGLKWNKSIRWSFYMLLIFCIFYFQKANQEFIYFQF